MRLSVVTLFAVALVAGALAFAGGAPAQPDRVGPAVSATATASCSFGLSTVGTFNGSISSNTKKVTQYTAVACNITKLTGYVSGGNVNGGPQHVRAIVYADSGGLPGARLAVSNEVNIAKNQAGGWVDFPLPATVSISAGPIWMGYIGSSPQIGIPKYNGTGVAVRSNADTYSDGASDPFGTSTAGVVATYSLYASGTTPPPTIYDAPVPRYGISPGFNLDYTAAKADFEVDQIKRVGAKLVRIDWFPTGHSWHASAETEIDRVQAAGLEPEIAIYDTLKVPTSVTAQQYGSACSEAATTHHNEIRFYEVMNEQNSNGWTAQAYIPYLQACYDAVKAVDSRNIVLLGGLNPATQDTQVISWVSDLYANLMGARPFDYMNVHLYGDPPNPKTWSSWQKTFGPNVVPNIVSVMTQNGDGARTIVSTEGGQKIGAIGCDAPNYDQACSEQDQADIVSRYLPDSRLAQTYVYNMLDGGDGFGLLVQDPNGTIIAPDGTKWRRRPSFTSAQTVMGGTG